LWPFSVNLAGYTRFNEEVEADLAGTFERVNNSFVDNGIPVILGEYGLFSIDYTRPDILQDGEVLKFFEAFGYHARANDITTMLWDAGSFLNRDELQWRDPNLFAQIESSWTTRSGTASFDQVYVPATGAITRQTLQLNPNGTTFEGLWQGDAELVRGTDYTVSGDTLTLTEDALTRLAGDREHGVNAEIEARFSQGLPWRISIISYDAPVLSDATGTTDAFAIPTQFNGDQLAMMGATYADGTNAGPHDWTPFKEFYTTFQPDYGAGTIILKPELFAEVDDNAPVTLTFHFWSGEQITYTITTSGTSVTGTAS
jgi:endoglucanase